MTKKELLEMIEKSSLKYDVPATGLYAKYYPLIKSTLCFCPNDVELSFSSLNGFEKKDAFESFILNNVNNGASVIEDRLKALLTDLDTFSLQYIAANPAKVKSAGAVMYHQNEWNNGKQRKSGRVILFIALFIIFSAAVIVFTALDAGSVFTEGTPMATACAVIAAVSGAFDFVCGLLFFIYEHRDDKAKKQEVSQAAEKAIDGGDGAEKFIQSHPTVKIDVKIVDKSKRKFKMGKDSKIIHDNHGTMNF